MTDSKRYHDASDVLIHALVMLEDREKLREMKQAEFDAKIDAGLASADRGELFERKEVFAEMDAIIAEKAGGGQDAGEAALHA